MSSTGSKRTEGWGKCVGNVGLAAAVATLLLLLVGSVTMESARNADTARFGEIEHPFLSPASSGLWGHSLLRAGGPFPTSKWWMNLVVDQGESPVALMPYVIKALATGLQVRVRVGHLHCGDARRQAHGLRLLAPASETETATATTAARLRARTTPPPRALVPRGR